MFPHESLQQLSATCKYIWSQVFIVQIIIVRRSKKLQGHFFLSRKKLRNIYLGFCDTFHDFRSGCKTVGKLR